MGKGRYELSSQAHEYFAAASRSVHAQEPVVIGRTGPRDPGDVRTSSASRAGTLAEPAKMTDLCGQHDMTPQSSAPTCGILVPVDAGPHSWSST